MIGSAATPKNTPPAVTGIGLGVFLIASCVVAFRFLNSPGALRDDSPTLEELEAQGLVTKQEFTAKRTFAVEEFEDEGMHYFLELADGRVLFLTGQYLYDYTLIDDDPELNQPQTFPNTNFVINRHAAKGYVIHIECRGQALQSEVTAPSFTKSDYDNDRVPDDGQLISDRTYDQVKSERLSSKPRR